MRSEATRSNTTRSNTTRSKTSALLLGASLLGLVACAEESVAPLPCEPGGRDEISFDSDDMLCVQVEMNDADFEELGRQFRFEGEAADQFDGLIQHVLASCTEPFPDPYTYFPADVVVDGQDAAAVGVRKKGFLGSTWSPARPSLKLKTDIFVDDQELGDGTERVTLNNNLTDFTRMRTCLAYSVFDDAGYPAPRCNLANVMVNGESLGVYTHVESIKKDFLEYAFGSRDGSLYEATASDFTDEYFADGLGRWEAKTSETEPSAVLLQGIVDALKAPDEELEAALNEVIDLDLFLRFWALETVVSHVDGYGANTNNSYLYFDPDNGGRGVFIPWGTDDSMTAEDLGAPTESDEEDFARGELTRRLTRHPELHQAYLDALQVVLDEVWDEERLLARVESFDAQVLTYEPETETRTDAVDALKDFIAGRRAKVEGIIEGGGVIGGDTPRACSAIIDFIVVEEFGEIAATFSHSCASHPVGPGGRRAAGQWVAGLLALLVLRRRRGEGA